MRALALALAAAALAGCGTASRAAAPARPDCRRPLPRDLASPGPYRVRTRTFALTRPGRALNPVAWWPQAPAGCRFPLIVFSHGADSRPQSYSRLTARLASDGFAVIGPHHPDATARGDEAADRVADVRYVLAHLPAALPADTRAIGLAGHSFGGFTAAAVAALEPRARALVVMAAGAPPAVAAHIRAATLVIAGGADRLVPASRTHGFYRSLPRGIPRRLLVIPHRGHNSYANTCAKPAVRTCATVQRAVAGWFVAHLRARSTG